MGGIGQQMQQMPREHHFYVSIAKFLFQHPEYGVVSVQEPIKIEDARRYQLNPIILYGLTVPRLPIRWMTFTPFDKPRAFRDVLFEGWRNASGLRGRPDILRVSRLLAKASPELVEDMAMIGVQVEVADAKEKSPSRIAAFSSAVLQLLAGRFQRKGRASFQKSAGTL